VYSYGVVLLELLTGKEPSHDPSYGEALDIVAWVKESMQLNEGRVSESVLDPSLRHSKDSAATKEMLCVQEIALLCTQKNPADRPTMRDVETMLETLSQKSEKQNRDGDRKDRTSKGNGAKTNGDNENVLSILNINVSNEGQESCTDEGVGIFTI
jgi:serine/threonine protein kinase